MVILLLMCSPYRRNRYRPGGLTGVNPNPGQIPVPTTPLYEQSFHITILSSIPETCIVRLADTAFACSVSELPASSDPYLHLAIKRAITRGVCGLHVGIAVSLKLMQMFIDRMLRIRRAWKLHLRPDRRG